MAIDGVSPEKQLEAQIDRLVDETEGERSREEIERQAQEVVSDLGDAPVQQFVPNLVYNEVKSRIVEDKARKDEPSS